MITRSEFLTIGITSLAAGSAPGQHERLSAACDHVDWVARCLQEGGDVGLTGVGNLPRPKERGGCDCPTCTHPENLKLLEEWEKKRAALLALMIPASRSRRRADGSP